MRLFGRRSRRYPIIRDEYGQSARQRAFDLFQEGNRPAQVYKMLPISFNTTCRYFQDWNKNNSTLPYSKTRKLMTQGRFKNIAEEQIKQLQDRVDRRWQRFLERAATAR